MSLLSHRADVNERLRARGKNSLSSNGSRGRAADSCSHRGALTSAETSKWSHFPWPSTLLQPSQGCSPTRPSRWAWSRARFPKSSLHQGVGLGQLIIEKSTLGHSGVASHSKSQLNIFPTDLTKTFSCLLLYYCVINIILINNESHDELLRRSERMMGYLALFREHQLSTTCRIHRAHYIGYTNPHLARTFPAGRTGNPAGGLA